MSSKELDKLQVVSACSDKCVGCVCSKTKPITTQDNSAPPDMVERNSGAKKADKQKPDLSMVPYEFVAATARAFGYGKMKYGRNNWRKGLELSTLARATVGHVLKWCDGEEHDDESNLCHLDHAAASLAMLIATYATKPELDDRGIVEGMVRYKSDKVTK